MTISVAIFRSTLQDDFKNYNYKHPEDGVNVKTAISNMDYNRRKLLEIFPDDMLEKVIRDSPDTDFAKYWDCLEQAISKYNKTGLFDNLAVKLTKPVMCLSSRALTDWGETTMKFWSNGAALSLSSAMAGGCFYDGGFSARVHISLPFSLPFLSQNIVNKRKILRIILKIFRTQKSLKPLKNKEK